MQVGGFGFRRACVAHEGDWGSGRNTVADALQYAAVALVDRSEIARVLHYNEMAIVGVVPGENDHAVGNTANGAVHGAPDVKTIVVFVRTEELAYRTKGRRING